MPRKALTAARIDRIKPPASGQVELFDKGYPGLALRVSYGGGKSFVYFYRIGGKLRRMTFGTYPALSLSDAHEAWRKARADLAAGRDPSLVRKLDAPGSDFESVALDWLKKDQTKNKSVKEVERIVRRELLPAWGHRGIAEIGRRDILDLIDGIADRGSIIMARRVQAYVHRLFRWAVGRGIIDVNPASDLPKPGAETKRSRVLTDSELAALWHAAGKIGWPFGDAVRLLILTGARREEIGQLKWSEIAGDTIALGTARTKNAEPHSIPLSLAAIDVLQRVPRIAQCQLIFSTNGTSPVSGWSRAKTKLDVLSGVKDWRIHDLRRTVSTGMNELGTEPHIVEAVLGHTVKGVAGVYNRAKYEAAKRVALEAWSAHVMALVQH